MSANLSISKIIQKAGGPDAIAARSKVSRWAVYKWLTKGIPDPHWPLLMELAAVTADDLFKANLQARSPNGRPPDGDDPSQSAGVAA